MPQPLFTGQPTTQRPRAAAIALLAGTITALPGLAIAQEAPPASAPARAPLGEPSLGQTADGEAPGSVAATLRDARALLDRGLAVQARAVLDTVDPAAALSLSDGDRTAYERVRSRVRAAIARLTPVEISIQSAQVGVARDRLAEAERHARAVLDSGSAGELQRGVAETLLSLIRSRRAVLASEAPALIAAAERAFDEGRYAEARSSLVSMRGWGLELDRGLRGRMDRTLGRLEQLASSGGGADGFSGSAVALGELGRRVGDQPAQAGGDQPAGGDDQPAQGDQPAEGDQPAAGGEDDQPVGEDPVQTALRVEALRLLSMADQAFEDRRLTEAEREYGVVLEAPYRRFLSEAQVERAEENRAEAQLLLRGAEGPGGLLEEERAERQVERQQIEAVVESLLNEASRMLQTGEYTAARDAAAAARLEINRGRDLFSEAEYEARIEEIEATLDDIARAEEQAEVRARRERQAELAAEAEQREAEVAAERRQKINELLLRVRELQAQRNYEKALQEVEQILFLDPGNPSGLILRDVLKESLLFSRYERASRERQLGFAEQTVRNMESTIPPRNVMEFPDDWAAITERRGGPLQFREPEANKAVLDRLRSQRTDASFDDVPLQDVVTFISSIGELNTDVNWDSLDTIAIDRDTPVSLNLSNVTLETVLNRTLEKASEPDLPADWAIFDGVLTVASEEVLRRETVLEVYQIQDLILRIPEPPPAPQFDLQTVFQAGGGQGGGGGGQSPFQLNQQGQQQDQEPIEERIQPVVDVIRNNVDPTGWQDAGGTTGRIETFQGNLIITNTAKNHREIYGLLNKLRAVRNLQISVESRFLIVDEQFFEQIGFDLDLFLNGDSPLVSDFAGSPNTGDPQLDQLLGDPTVTPSEFFQDADGDGTPDLTTAGAVPGGPVYDTDGDGIADLTPTPFVNPEGLSPIQFNQNSTGIVDVLGSASGLGAQINTLGPALAVGGRFLDDIQVDFLIEATQADTRSVTLNAPRVTFTNGQSSNIFVASQESFVSGLNPVVAGSAVAFAPQVDVISTGVNLVVDGVVSADRRYVTLNVRTQIADVQLGGVLSMDGQGQGQGAVGGGGVVGGGDQAAIAQASITLPTVTITSVATTVTIPDQGTILLGGQRLVEEQVVESGVPVLSKVPVLNRFFSNRLETKDESTLLILLRPEVIIQSEEEDQAFPGLLDSIGQ